jgi:hypothetical protein
MHTGSLGRVEREVRWRKVNVAWEDEPTDAAVVAVTARYGGRKINGMTEGCDDAGSALVAFEGEKPPKDVSYTCDRILTRRHYTIAGYSAAQ